MLLVFHSPSSTIHIHTLPFFESRHLDPDGVYARKSNSVSIVCEERGGICLLWLALRARSCSTPHTCARRSRTSTWRPSYPMEKKSYQFPGRHFREEKDPPRTRAKLGQTHVDLLHLCPQLGDILLDSRSGSQPLQLLFNRLYTLKMVRHLYPRLISYVRVGETPGALPCWCCPANLRHYLAAGSWRACIPAGGSRRHMRMPRKIRRTDRREGAQFWG